jgi:hypothetical protein
MFLWWKSLYEKNDKIDKNDKMIFVSKLLIKEKFTLSKFFLKNSSYYRKFIIKFIIIFNFKNFLRKIGSNVISL